MLTLNDGRSELWQWDTGRKLNVDADCTQVHFSNKVFGRSIDVDVVGGIAIIPDILLQTDKELTAWAFVGTAENGYTKISKVFKVNKRNKPADYVFTPTDQTTLGEILDRIEALENRPSGDVSKEDIENAVNDYLDKNPVSVEEKDPTVPSWAKQPNPPKQPTTLPNPHKLTFTGAVTAEYDGSEPVEVKIPEGGGGGIEVTGAEIGQTIVVKAVDENGKPTEWECADLPMGSLLEGCEVITYGTLSEDSGIVLTADINGNPFSLTKAVLIAHGGFTGTILDFGYNGFTKLKQRFSVKCNVGASRFVGILKKGAAMESMQTGADFLIMSHQANYYLEKNDDQVVMPSLITENITKVQCVPWNGNGKFTANTNYILYGVRA